MPGASLAMLGLPAAIVVLWGSSASAVADGGRVTRTYATQHTQGAFVVPAGVEAIEVVAVGGAGGSSTAAKGGLGARVEGALSVTPGATLYVEVGADGHEAAHGAGSGGGSSDVRTAPREAGLEPDDRLIVAGAGGGAGNENKRASGRSGNGGNAGGEEGAEGQSEPRVEGGTGGTQTKGGFGGEAFGGEAEECLVEPTPSEEGERETGGLGEFCRTLLTEGGGGGAGYFGGGGGGAGKTNSAGGGGGSSLVPAGGSERLAEGEAPQVQISYIQPANPPAVVTGAASELRRETATVHATVNPEDEEVTGCEFEWGASEAYGNSVPCSSNPGSGVAPVEVSAQLTGLSAETTYHFRIVATNADGTSYGADATFTTPPHNPPAITSIGPEAGPVAGGESVTISGSEFFDVTSVKFGSAPAKSFEVDSPESITAVTPAGTGTVTVTVTTAAGTSPGVPFVFLPLPVVTKVSPKKGPVTGGTSVQIEGSGFDSASTVSFGASPASSVTVNSPTSITAVSPPGTAPGTVNVTVTTPHAGTSAIVKKDKFKYTRVKR